MCSCLQRAKLHIFFVRQKIIDKNLLEPSPDPRFLSDEEGAWSLVALNYEFTVTKLVV